MYTTPRIALAMFIMAFVGVVRGLWGSRRFHNTSERRRRLLLLLRALRGGPKYRLRLVLGNNLARQE